MKRLRFFWVMTLAGAVSCAMLLSSCSNSTDPFANDMVYVQGGTFMMGATSEQGSDVNDREKPTHRVTVSDFYISKYEVTQEQWKEIMGTNPSYFKGDNLPVENVSWNDVQEFIAKLNEKTGMNYRLPTEAEWEYAARGGNKSKGYKYSGGDDVDEVAWYYDNSTSNDDDAFCYREHYDDETIELFFGVPDDLKRKSHSVGTKAPNELGLYDMSGNVWEWCSDWFGDYGSWSQTNPKGATSGSRHVRRGGSWRGYTRYCRVSYRGNYGPDSGLDYLGFRLARSL